MLSRFYQLKNISENILQQTDYLRNIMRPTSFSPYKSTAIALIFSILFGPVGLLYASFWGGLSMIAIGIVVINSKLSFPIILLWLICCIWSVGAIELYNKKIRSEIIYAEKNH
jgi:hypothetical protein